MPKFNKGLDKPASHLIIPITQTFPKLVFTPSTLQIWIDILEYLTFMISIFFG